MPAQATGHIRVLPRKGGDVHLAKLKLARSRDAQAGVRRATRCDSGR